MEVSEAVKQDVSKLEGATQKSEFWGQIWGQKMRNRGKKGHDKCSSG